VGDQTNILAGFQPCMMYSQGKSASKPTILGNWVNFSSTHPLMAAKKSQCPEPT
jgi:hypothetical protein